MAHRIGGRKLSRKQGPRLALFKNLTVSVLRYERVKTTEAKAKEISGQVEKVITPNKKSSQPPPPEAKTDANATQPATGEAKPPEGEAPKFDDAYAPEPPKRT